MGAKLTEQVRLKLLSEVLLRHSTHGWRPSAAGARSATSWRRTRAARRRASRKCARCRRRYSRRSFG